MYCTFAHSSRFIRSVETETASEHRNRRLQELVWRALGSARPAALHRPWMIAMISLSITPGAKKFGPFRADRMSEQ